MNDDAVKDRQDDEIDLMDLLAVLLRHKKMIIGTTLAAALVVVVLSIVSLLLPPDVSFMPNVYTPRAVMLISQPESGGISGALAASGLGGLASMAGISGGGGKSYGALAEYLTGMNSYLDAVVDRFDLVERYEITKHLRADSRQALKEKMAVRFDDPTGVLTLSFEDIDPAFAAEVVNYAVELLDRRFAVIGGNRNQMRKNQLEEKLAEVSAEMNRLENEIQAFQTRYGVISVESLAGEHIATIARVRSELMMKEMEIKTYSDLARVEDPQIRRLRAERANLMVLLRELEEGFQSFESVMPSQRELPRIALEFSHLQRDLMIQVEIYKLLIQQYETTKLALTGEDPLFQVLEAAMVPDKKSGPGRGLLCIVVTMAAFFLSVFGAFVRQAVWNIKRDPLQMDKLSRAWRGQ